MVPYVELFLAKISITNFILLRKNMMRPQQLKFTRLFTSNTISCKDCCWEDIIKAANCKKEAKKLDHIEECEMCIPAHTKDIDSPEEVTDMRPITGVPPEAYHRNTAIIEKRAKNVMQQGTANTHDYIMSYTNDIQWENPLMGWTSGSNSLKDVEISFPNKEKALHFAEKNGWNLIVPKEHTRKKFKKNYAENFSWSCRTRVSTK